MTYLLATVVIYTRYNKRGFPPSSSVDGKSAPFKICRLDIVAYTFDVQSDVYPHPPQSNDCHAWSPRTWAELSAHYTQIYSFFYKEFIQQIMRILTHIFDCIR